jgi:beta-lactam-binding protein with PASTA domain
LQGIFISYRRDDAAGHAGRLFDRLSEHHGRSRVFMDVAGIEAGVDFVEAIDRAVASCQVLLVMIGRQWLKATDEHGRRRLDDPGDFHRLEIATALSRNIRVIPILVEGSRMPAAEELPEALVRLARRQAVELRDSRWDADVQDLIVALDRALAPAATTPGETPGGHEVPRAEVAPTPVAPSARTDGESPPSPWPAPPAHPRRWLLFGGLGALVTAGLAAFFLLKGPTPVEVPNLVGRFLDGAVQQLRSAGLEAGETTGTPVPNVPAGQIVRQSPPPGTRVDRGTRVQLTVAEAAPRTVPDLVGKPLPEAEDILARAGFKAGSVREEEASAAPPRTVLRQDPGPGTAVKGEAPAIALVIARRPTPSPIMIDIPNVVGTQLDLAMATLKRAGLAPDARTGQPNRTQPTYQVVDQKPKAGAKVARGTQVVVIFNPERKLTVPDVVGMPWMEARDLLSRTGFGVSGVEREQTDRSLPGTVLEQSPAGGAEVLEKAAVVILRVAVAKAIPPDSAGTVDVCYSDVPSEVNLANGLATHLRQIGFQVDSLIRIRLRGEGPTGHVDYFSAADEERAAAIAKRSVLWLSKNGRQNARLEPRLVISRYTLAQFAVYVPTVKGFQPPVRLGGDLQIPQTYAVDLDDGQVGLGTAADLWFEAKTPTRRFLTPRGGASLAPSPQPRPSYDDCVAAKYGMPPVPVERLVEGAAYCVRTNGGRYAAVIVLHPVGPSPGTLEVRYITWE